MIGISAFSQKNNHVNKFATASLAFGAGQFSYVASINNNWQLGKKQKFEIGLGLRYTGNSGSNQYFTTAPAKLTSGKTGPAVFFADDIIPNIDSVLIAKYQANSLNLAINLGYNFSNKFSVGFNIDAIGFSFGGNKPGKYFNNAGSATNITAKPTAFNLLLISDNDLGSLNSEFFGQYKFNKKWSGRLAFQFLFNEYTTSTKVQTTPTGEKNDRFRSKQSGISFGIVRNF